jgi:uncharacterized LabA/DUF88 family protein
MLQPLFQKPTTPALKCWAYIDFQNLYKGIEARKWTINWPAFREYLRSQHNVVKAIGFMGYVPQNKSLYQFLEFSGYEFEFRETKRIGSKVIDGGNIDTDLVASAMDNKNNYDRIILVSDDSDYLSMLMRLQRQNKLHLVISSHPLRTSSHAIRRVVRKDQLISIHSLRPIIECR